MNLFDLTEHWYISHKLCERQWAGKGEGQSAGVRGCEQEGAFHPAGVLPCLFHRRWPTVRCLTGDLCFAGIWQHRWFQGHRHEPPQRKESDLQLITEALQWEETASKNKPRARDQACNVHRRPSQLTISSKWAGCKKKKIATICQLAPFYSEIVDEQHRVVHS